MLVAIHDEILMEYPRKRLRDLRDVLRGVREVMIDFPMFDLPLEVDFEIATVDWEKKKGYEL